MFQQKEIFYSEKNVLGWYNLFLSHTVKIWKSFPYIVWRFIPTLQRNRKGRFSNAVFVLHESLNGILNVSYIRLCVKWDLRYLQVIRNMGKTERISELFVYWKKEYLFARLSLLTMSFLSPYTYILSRTRDEILMSWCCNELHICTNSRVHVGCAFQTFPPMGGWCRSRLLID